MNAELTEQNDRKFMRELIPSRFRIMCAARDLYL